MPQPVRLMRGGLSGRIYAVTKYKVLDPEKDLIEAITKFDVTEDFSILAMPVCLMCNRPMTTRSECERCVN